MSARPDPNANRQPGEPFRYKPRPKLEASDPTLIDRMVQAGMHNMSHEEAAAILGVSRSTLELFWESSPDHRAAFDAGKQLRKARLRAIVDRHAMLDPPTARFLAKNELGMSDDPSKAKADEASAAATNLAMSKDEAIARIREIRQRLISASPARETARETIQRSESRYARRAAELGDEVEDVDEAAQSAGAMGPEGLLGSEEARGGGESADRARSAPPAPIRAQQEGSAQSQAGEGGALEKLHARIAELEASAVRKNPRKDGKPHTDRTKAPVDSATNRSQEGRSRVPGRLPGRIERR